MLIQSLAWFYPWYKTKNSQVTPSTSRNGEKTNGSRLHRKHGKTPTASCEKYQHANNYPLYCAAQSDPTWSEKHASLSETEYISLRNWAPLNNTSRTSSHNETCPKKTFSNLTHPFKKSKIERNVFFKSEKINFLKTNKFTAVSQYVSELEVSWTFPK